MEEDQQQSLMIHKIAVVVIAVVALAIIALAILITISIFKPLAESEDDDILNDTALTRIEVCVEGEYPNGPDYFECKRKEKISIVAGSEMISSNYAEECAKYDDKYVTEPYMEEVGGIVGIRFRGCQVKSKK